MLLLSEVWEHDTQRMNEVFKGEVLLDGFENCL
jgi:hypothetical protein